MQFSYLFILILIPTPQWNWWLICWIQIICASVCRRHGFQSITSVFLEFQFQISYAQSLSLCGSLLTCRVQTWILCLLQYFINLHGWWGLWSIIWSCFDISISNFTGIFAMPVFGSQHISGVKKSNFAFFRFFKNLFTWFPEHNNVAVTGQVIPCILTNPKKLLLGLRHPSRSLIYNC